ncbi:iron-containing redox enzyme family protein [Ralstonia insidiosa]|uniref:Iron-containing redox enzyme family protein n=1 Tax=Ralstonia insidiosa TaxID=190721 RepID=A0A848P272_9RALS|nr:iron-containing redox enzyme family protein [Ralstonia insidiosa]NMV41831.1 iron-containing redox enzyme family protein [Ralstonia insidiosa]
MTNSEQLMQVLRTYVTQYPQTDMAQPAVFAGYLAFIHDVIIASEHILEAASERSSGELQRFFSEHLEEEHGHAEWLEEDLASAGIDLAARLVVTEAVAMAGSQYYLIRHIDPAAVLGYMAVLECFPMSKEQVEKLEEIHGQKLCRTLRYHATHDVQHGADVLKMIDALPSEQLGIVIQNAVQTALYFISAASKFAQRGDEKLATLSLH